MTEIISFSDLSKNILYAITIGLQKFILEINNIISISPGNSNSHTVMKWNSQQKCDCMWCIYIIQYT